MDKFQIALEDTNGAGHLQWGTCNLSCDNGVKVVNQTIESFINGFYWMKTRNAVTHYKYIIYYSTTFANNKNYCVIE